MTESSKPRDLNALTMENYRQAGEIERLRKGRVSGPLALMIATFFAGIIVNNVFFPGAPPADLRAEYCRGIGDGEMRSYNSVRQFVLDIESKAGGMGLSAVSVAINAEGEIVESVILSEKVFPARAADINLQIEAACAVLTIDQMVNQFGVRGPSNEVASPPTPIAGGGGPLLDK